MSVNKLKRFGLAVVLAGLPLCAAPAMADSISQFDFSFAASDDSVSGSGVLNVTENSDLVSYTATSGSITLPDPLVSNTSNGFTGTFALDSGANDALYPSAGLSPDGKSYFVSSDGYFYFDNQLYYPSANNPDLPGFLLDIGGLLFTSGGSNPQEINLYQSGSYVYYENNGVNDQVNFTITPAASPATTTAVPLPPAVGVISSMLGAGAVVLYSRKRVSRLTASPLLV